MFDHNLYFMACKRVLRANVESGKEEMVFKKSLKNYNGTNWEILACTCFSIRRLVIGTGIEDPTQKDQNALSNGILLSHFPTCNWSWIQMMLHCIWYLVKLPFSKIVLYIWMNFQSYLRAIFNSRWMKLQNWNWKFSGLAWFWKTLLVWVFFRPKPIQLLARCEMESSFLTSHQLSKKIIFFIQR